MKAIKAGLLLSFTLCFSSVSAIADDTGLYDRPPPSDAVFVRWIGDDAPWSKPFWGLFLGERNLPAYAYVALSAANIAEVEPGGYYSIVANPEDNSSISIIAEPQRDRVSKVYIVLLNAGNGDASLRVSGGGPVVIGATAALSAGIRAVNPVAATLQIHTHNRSEDFEIALRRGQNITFIAENDGVYLIPNTFGPVVELE
ncbi:hypothetical protein [Cochlodiniinecator piscidefendens]|uniref:hypothetical protein n=1 Tax=Cochlodiniinecator piscidefendens TaxID=2715756 RepID=UPI0014076815|nr:hypothetical protein [Cochlodiniinecator piscidefendens]